MSNFFSMDNGLFSFIGKACDVIVLSFIWMIFCIPIITIGPASTAMYYATVKVIRRERGYLFREFLKSFRLNFKRGAAVGVILTLAYVILGFDLLWSWGSFKSLGNNATILFGIFIAITSILLCITLYIFPILSRFDMTVKQLFKAAVLMSVKHILYTLGMVLITVITIFAIWLMPFLIIIIPAVATLLNSLLMERVLKKYIPKADESEKDGIKDEWYLE